MGAEHRDLSIESVLADPLIRAANKADRVSLQEFERLLRATARELKAGMPGRAPEVRPVTRGLCDGWSPCFA